MLNIIWVGVGGAIGSICRYLISSKLAIWVGSNFPWPIIMINMMGCFLAGGLGRYLSMQPVIPSFVSIHAFLIIGFLGGFTTFSSFSLDFLSLYSRGFIGQSLLYVGLSLFLSLSAAFLGVLIVEYCCRG